MRLAVVLLALAGVALAEDELYDTTWIVGDKGELLGWPDPEVGDRMLKTFKPFPVFKADVSDLFADTCPVSWALFLACGRSDIASLCDAPTHLRKTDQLAFDESVEAWIYPFEELPPLFGGLDTSKPVGRRALLDRLLLMRIAELRGLRGAIDEIDSVAKSEEVDTVTSLAAAEIRAALRRGKSPAIDLPPLRGVPADADVLLVVDERRVPRWRDIWRLHRTYAVRQARQVIARIGIAVTPMDLSSGQWMIEREGEMFYELARRFGNARFHRMVLALRVPEGRADLSTARFFLRGEGIFDPGRFKEGCDASGVKSVEAPGGVITGRFGDFDVTVRPEQLLVSRSYPIPAPAGEIPQDLAKLGLGGDDAIWIRCRGPFADRLPVKGIESLTLRASFEGGVTLRCRAGFKDAESASAAAAEVERWKSADLTPVSLPGIPFRDVRPEAIARVKAFLGSLKLSVDGTTVTAEATAKGETPESLYEGVVDLAAIYDTGED